MALILTGAKTMGRVKLDGGVGECVAERSSPTKNSTQMANTHESSEPRPCTDFNLEPRKAIAHRERQQRGRERGGERERKREGERDRERERARDRERERERETQEST